MDSDKSAKETRASTCPICISESQLCNTDQLEAISCRDVSQTAVTKDKSHPWATTVFPLSSSNLRQEIREVITNRVLDCSVCVCVCKGLEAWVRADETL